MSPLARKSVRLATIFLLLLAGRPVAAGDRCARPMADPLDYSKLKEWITACKPGSVGEVVRSLPLNYKLNASFVYQSRAESEVAHPGTVDALHPRVILFGGPDFILTYTGKPGTPSYSELQLIQYVRATGRIGFKTVHLGRPGYTEPATFDENPKTCVQCHGNPARTLWESYPRWPGVYGSNDDTLIEKSAERKSFELFAASVARPDADERYAELNRARPLGERFQFGRSELTSLDMKIRPNATLGFVLQEIFARSFARKFTLSNPNRLVRDLFLWAAFSCNQTAKPSEIDAFAKRLDKGKSSLPKGVPEVLAKGLRKIGDAAIEDTLFFSVSGMNPAGISTSLAPDAYYATGLRESLRDFIYYEISREWAGSSIKAGHLLDPYPNGKPTPIYATFYRPRSYDPGFCRKLAAGDPKAPDPSTPPFIRASTPPPPSPSPLPALRNPFGRCTDCHGEGGIGPRIAFESEKGLRAELRSDPGLRASIFAEIDSRRMPKVGIPLTEEQIADIKNYVEILKK